MIKSKLKEILDEKCINRAMFSRKLGVSKQTIDNWLRDKNYPTMEHMKQIAKILDMTVIEIFFNEEETG